MTAVRHTATAIAVVLAMTQWLVAQPPTAASPPSSGNGQSGQEPGSEQAPELQAPELQAPIAPDARVIQFSFANMPWEHVLQEFARRCGLILQMDVKPTGTFNYILDRNKYTMPEAMDKLNKALLPKGHYLVRDDNFLIVVALDEDGVPARLIPRVGPADLEKRGKTEFVSVIFPVTNSLAEEVQEELANFNGPGGKVVTLKTTNQVMVTDTVQNVLLIRDMLKQIDGEGSVLQTKTRTFKLKYAIARNVEATVRDLLGLPPRETTGQPEQPQRRDRRSEFIEMMMRRRGGSFFDRTTGDREGDRRQRPQQQQQQQTGVSNVFISVDDRTNTLFVRAPADLLAQVENWVDMLDVPSDNLGDPQVPVTRMYRLSDGDAESFAAALRAIYQNYPGVRFSADQNNNMVVAFAPPEEQESIAQLVKEFENDERDLAVVELSSLDASAVAEVLNSVYSSGERDLRGRSVVRPGQPRIQADVSRNTLVIYGSQKQVRDIRNYLASMGESLATPAAVGGRMRVIRIDPQNAEAVQRVLRELGEKVLPNNTIRVIQLGRRTMDSQGGTNRPGLTSPSSGGSRNPEAGRSRRLPSSSPRSPAGNPRQDQPTRVPGNSSTRRHSDTAVRFVSYIAAVPGEPEGQSDSAQQATPEKRSSEVHSPNPTVQAPDVVVSFAPNGDLVIVSEDTKAVDTLVNLLKPFLNSSSTAGPGITVFPLNSAEATQVAETLRDMLGLSSFPFGGQTTALRIVSDTRMNALLVSGNATDVERVRQLLEVLDRDDIQSGALSTPWIIPVRYSSAADIAQVIRDVYAGQLVQGAGGPRGSRGFTVGGVGRSGSGGSTGNRGSGLGTVSIGVDEGSNSLVISCSESMFREITQLVEALDNAANDADRTIRIVTLRSSTPSAVQAALNGLLGIRTEVRSGQAQNNNRDFYRGDFRRPPFPPGRPTSDSRGSDRDRDRGDFDRNRNRESFDRGGQGGFRGFRGGFPGRDRGR